MSCTSADLLQNEIKEFQSLLHMYSQIWDLTLIVENQTWILLTNPIFIHAAFLNLHNQQYSLVLLNYTSIRKAWFKRTAELLNELRSIKWSFENLDGPKSVLRLMGSRNLLIDHYFMDHFDSNARCIVLSIHVRI